MLDFTLKVLIGAESTAGKTVKKKISDSHCSHVCSLSCQDTSFIFTLPQKFHQSKFLVILSKFRSVHLISKETFLLNNKLASEQFIPFK